MRFLCQVPSPNVPIHCSDLLLGKSVLRIDAVADFISERSWTSCKQVLFITASLLRVVLQIYLHEPNSLKLAGNL